jgi:hypothetical protein
VAQLTCLHEFDFELTTFKMGVEGNNNNLMMNNIIMNSICQCQEQQHLRNLKKKILHKG